MKKRHLHAHASHQGQLCCLKQWPAVFKELKCYLPTNRLKNQYGTFHYGAALISEHYRSILALLAILKCSSD
jgi:hypothetical protein